MPYRHSLHDAQMSTYVSAQNLLYENKKTKKQIKTVEFRTMRMKIDKKHKLNSSHESQTHIRQRL